MTCTESCGRILRNHCRSRGSSCPPRPCHAAHHLAWKRPTILPAPIWHAPRITVCYGAILCLNWVASADVVICPTCILSIHLPLFIVTFPQPQSHPFVNTPQLHSFTFVHYSPDTRYSPRKCCSLLFSCLQPRWLKLICSDVNKPALPVSVPSLPTLTVQPTMSVTTLATTVPMIKVKSKLARLMAPILWQDVEPRVQQMLDVQLMLRIPISPRIPT